MAWHYLLLYRSYIASVKGDVLWSFNLQFSSSKPCVVQWLVIYILGINLPISSSELKTLIQYLEVKTLSFFAEIS